MHIRLMTYNIHKGIGGIDRRYRLARVREVLEHYRPDIVFLQEVDTGARRSRREHQVDVLGDALELPYRVYFPMVTLLTGGAYGNAILSRLPLVAADILNLTLPPKKRRSAVYAHCQLEGRGGKTKMLHLCNLHLGLSGVERRLQLARFLRSRLMAEITDHEPLVLAGDFNDVWGSLGPSLLLPRGFCGPTVVQPTFPAYAPLRALDAIYTRGALTLRRSYRSALSLAREASDHLPVIAELEL